MSNFGEDSDDECTKPAYPATGVPAGDDVDEEPELEPMEVKVLNEMDLQQMKV